jgi:hypothetical protein
VAALAVLSIVWSAVGELRTPRMRDAATALALIGLVATTVVLLRDLPVTVPEEQMSLVVEAVGPSTAGALSREERYLVRGFDPKVLGAASSGLYVDLDHRGFEVYVDPDDFSSIRYGSWREATPQQVDAMVMIVDLPDLQLGMWRPPPGSRLVASYDPLTAAQRVRAQELAASIRESLGPNAPPGRISIGLSDVVSMEKLGVSRSAIEELHALEQPGDGYAVYLTPPPPA